MRRTIPAAKTSLFCQDLGREKETQATPEFKNSDPSCDILNYHVFLILAQLVGFVPSVHLLLLLPLFFGKDCHRHSACETLQHKLFINLYNVYSILLI